MTFPLDYIGYLNIALVAVFVITIILGVKKGFLSSLLDFVGAIVVFLISYLIAPVLAGQFALASNFINIDVGNEFINQLIFDKSNELIWFVIIFVVGMIVVAVVKKVTDIVSKLPGIKQLNSLLGGVFGVIYGWIICLVVVFVFSTPLVKNGRIIIERSLLGDIEAKSSVVLNMMGNPEEFNNALQDIINGNGISSDYAEEFENWIRKYISDDDAIKKIIDQYVNESEG